MWDHPTGWAFNDKRFVPKWPDRMGFPIFFHLETIQKKPWQLGYRWTERWPGVFKVGTAFTASRNWVGFIIKVCW